MYSLCHVGFAARNINESHKCLPYAGTEPATNRAQCFGLNYSAYLQNDQHITHVPSYYNDRKSTTSPKKFTPKLSLPHRINKTTHLSLNYQNGER